MGFNRYYEKELVALRALGKEFSESNPALAPFLNTPGRDPDVERILEGFAFLTGRLRQKLDDELPEITHALFNLLWPNYLRPLPACSVIQFTPPEGLSGVAQVPRSSNVQSVPVDGTHCQFRTAYDTEIHPIELIKLSFMTKDGEAIMALRFRTRGVNVDSLDFNSLRFFLNGETTIVHTLYHCLVRKMRLLRLYATDIHSKEVFLAELDSQSVHPVGFAHDEYIYPYPPNTFSGYRILQEYFCFPEKFHFIDILNLGQGFNKERLADVEGGTEFSIHCVLTDLPANFEAFTKDNLCLFCTPVVNLFPMQSSPLTLDHKQTEYRIVPDPQFPYHYSTYNVESVESWETGSKGYRCYKPFESFEHRGEDGDSAYYRLRVQASATDESVETYISFVSQSETTLPQNATISIDLVCTNRLLPMQLGVGDICRALDTGVSSIPFRNIIPVTPPYAPPLTGDTLWRLLSNMSLNYLPLTNINALRGIVSTYDFRSVQDSRRARVLDRILEGMVSIQSRETDRIYRGLPLRGTQTELSLRQRQFSCEGDMFLFASIINEFLALYGTVNSFHQLIVHEVEKGERYTWPARLGEQTL